MRHKWIDNTCTRCGMRRAKLRTWTTRGCCGSYTFLATVYVARDGRQLPYERKVPPCRPQ